jgi:hypothetical protein
VTRPYRILTRLVQAVGTRHSRRRRCCRFPWYDVACWGTSICCAVSSGCSREATPCRRSLGRTDPSRLRQVLTNLVGNGIKFRAKVASGSGRDGVSKYALPAFSVSWTCRRRAAMEGQVWGWRSAGSSSICLAEKSASSAPHQSLPPLADRDHISKPISVREARFVSEAQLNQVFK